MLILLSSWITDLMHNDNPFGAIILHRGNLLSHKCAEVHDLCTPKPLRLRHRNPQEQAVPVQRHPQLAPTAELDQKAPLNCRRMRFTPGEQHPFPKGSQKPMRFSGKEIQASC